MNSDEPRESGEQDAFDVVQRWYAATPGPRPDAVEAAESRARAAVETSVVDASAPTRSRRWSRLVMVGVPLAAAVAWVMFARGARDTSPLKSRQVAVEAVHQPIGPVIADSSVRTGVDGSRDTNHGRAATAAAPQHRVLSNVAVAPTPPVTKATTPMPERGGTHPLSPTTLASRADTPTLVPHILSARYDDVVAGLDSTSALLVTRLLDSAASRGVPMPSLIARVREGVQRGVPGPRIVVVARNYATALTDAQAVLGTSASPLDVQSGAQALLAGIPVTTLRQLRAARPAGALAEALVTLTDLAAHGVAPAGASTAVLALVDRGGSDAAMQALRADVIGDIVRGTPPDAALAGRLRQYEQHGPSTRMTADSIPLRRATP